MVRPAPALGRRCTICTHALLEDINKKLVLKSMPYRMLADKYDRHEDALRRHLTNHVSDEVRRKIIHEAHIHEQQAIADDLNGETVEVKSGLQNIVHEIELILRKAKARGDDPLALMSLKEMRQTLLDLAKVYGSLRSELTVNVNLNQSPQWHTLREILFEVFERHPDAKTDFLAQMRKTRLQDG